MMLYLIVFLGAGFGGMARHGVNIAAGRLIGLGFPWGTLTVNLVGSAIMGLAAGFFAFRTELPQHWRLFLMTGVLGGFTTFSAFSLDTVLLWERGEMGLAALYVAGSLAGAIGGLVIGLSAMRYAVS